MRLLRDLIQAIFALADAICLLATAITPTVEEEKALSEERFQKIMEKIRAEEEKSAEVPADEEENSEFPPPEGKVVEFSADAEGQEAAKMEMLDYLRGRGVVVEGTYDQQSPQDIAKELGIPFEALGIER